MLRGAEQSGAIEHEEQVLILLMLCFIFAIISIYLVSIPIRLAVLFTQSETIK